MAWLAALFITGVSLIIGFFLGLYAGKIHIEDEARDLLICLRAQGIPRQILKQAVEKSNAFTWEERGI